MADMRSDLPSAMRFQLFSLLGGDVHARRPDLGGDVHHLTSLNASLSGFADRSSPSTPRVIRGGHHHGPLLKPPTEFVYVGPDPRPGVHVARTPESSDGEFWEVFFRLDDLDTG